MSTYYIDMELVSRIIKVDSSTRANHNQAIEQINGDYISKLLKGWSSSMWKSIKQTTWALLCILSNIFPQEQLDVQTRRNKAVDAVNNTIPLKEVPKMHL